MPSPKSAESRRADLRSPAERHREWISPSADPPAAQKLEDEEIRDYNTAVRRLLAEQDIDFSVRNVLVAHQNVTANGRESIHGGSESMVGGVGQDPDVLPPGFILEFCHLQLRIGPLQFPHGVQRSDDLSLYGWLRSLCP